MRRLQTKILWLVVGIALAGFIAYGFYPQPIPVALVTPSRGVLEITVDDDGETQIREKYVVSTPVDGKMLRQQLEVGDNVTRSQTELARIRASAPSLLDARAHAESKARVRAAEAAVEQAEAVLTHADEKLELADHDYERARVLIGKNAMSRAEFDKAEHQYRIARADGRSAQFASRVVQHELEQARAALSYADSETDAEQSETFKIVSPIDGRVLKVFLKSAAVVTSGTSLVEIGDPKDMEIKIDVLSTDAVRIFPGNKVYIDHWGGKESLYGTVRLVEPAAFLKVSALGVEEKRVNVIVDISDPWEHWQSLGDGYRIEARIVVEATDEDTMKVPAGVLFRQGNLWHVFRVTDGWAELVPVELGRTNGLETEVVKGVDDQDVLILHPTDAIAHGVKVREAS